MKITRSSAPAALAAFAFVTVAASPAAFAAAPAGDPGVARLSALDGNVTVRRSDANQAFAAAPNAPVNVGDYLTTERNARAEIEFNYNALLRVAPETQLRFVKLDQHQHELQLAEGTVEMRVFDSLDAHPAVDTPAATIVPSDRGQYRVTVTHDGNTEVTVRSGKAQVEVGDSNIEKSLGPGSTMLITGSGANPTIKSIAVVASAAFDQWADSRDAKYAAVTTSPYVDDGMIGAADVNQSGQWSDNPTYGQVWQPNDVPAGWSPYSDGRWVWEPYYGWTWVGNEPWGYAPYHYGRWFYDDAWYWAPGTADAGFYQYAPAEVGFFGYGDGGDDGSGLFDGLFSNIGWSPLAPFETLVSWWGSGLADLFGGGNGWSGGFGGYQNSGAPGGAMGTSGGNFSGGQFGHIQPVGKGLLGGIKPIHGALPIVPKTTNLGADGKNLTPVSSPVSPRFGSLRPITLASKPFASVQGSIQTIVSHQLSRLSTERPTASLHASSARTAFASGHESNAGVVPHSAEAEYGMAEHYRGAQGGNATFEASAASRSSDAWSRFNDRPASSGRDDDRPAEPRAFPETMHAYSAAEPSRDFAESRPFESHAYSAPRSYEPRSYESRAYEPRSYAEPSRSYQPRSYSAPSRSYEPRYSAPSRSYSAPARTQSQPHYSAPAQRGGGNSGGGKPGRRR